VISLLSANGRSLPPTTLLLCGGFRMMVAAPSSASLTVPPFYSFLFGAFQTFPSLYNFSPFQLCNGNSKVLSFPPSCRSREYPAASGLPTMYTGFPFPSPGLQSSILSDPPPVFGLRRSRSQTTYHGTLAPTLIFFPSPISPFLHGIMKNNDRERRAVCGFFSRNVSWKCSRRSPYFSPIQTPSVRIAPGHKIKVRLCVTPIPFFFLL